MSPRDQSVDDSFKGLNITGRNNAIALNTENHGYTFFTRPLLNLSDQNCMVDRRLSQILNPNALSIERMVRAYLDPRAHKNGGDAWCGGVDPLNPFIPLLSNNLISLTGWEDFTINLATTTAGVYRDAMSYVDDVPYQYNTFDLQATFRNISGDPISWMFYIWLVYMGLNREGRILPYPDLLMRNEYDANTRIYRLVMDQTKTFVTRIAACGAALPMNSPTGQIMNYTGDGSETPFQVANDQLNFSFRCMGMTIYDHILIYEFNDLVETFNGLMRDGKRGRLTVKLQAHEKQWFNFQAYPYINAANMELEWHVPVEVYNARVGGNLTRPYKS
ncbi:virion structural protein [Pseudomonas phage PhiPA3]|uniref:Virion structural protein n=1 Tax=Pseudomonas phage PhiPA3 TaxID=998086 RepID=F8SJX0_BPPA3|nr:virion structural protein [Pseudomonas phage PhiPA3]AEH03515.1 virion structural protein [Pseudomonas phage PhiPA3]